MISKIKYLFQKTFGCEIEWIEKISAHGSQREYFRLYSQKITCLAATNEDKLENIAFLDYSNQLSEKGICVPKIYCQDLDNNLYFIEDLGNTTLYDLIELEKKGEISFQELRNLYHKVIEELPKIQILAGKDFDYSNAYPRKAFDKQSIAWDLNYFKYYFLKLSGIAYNEQELETDFQTLTNYLLSTNCNYFLFRDFQSRNIMIFNNEPAFIDYQGGRKGALEYDLASLLFDAKADLKPEFREELLELYIKEANKYIELDENKFRNYFYAYVYIRIMQAMGAYGFRGYFERKEHFLKSIPFALNNLKYLEENINLDVNIPYLHKIFNEMTNSEKLQNIAKQKLKLTINSFSYKRGYPQDLSGNGGGFVFDCRAIHNPGRYEEYKSLNGRDKLVIEFLEKENDAQLFFENSLEMVSQSIKTYLDRNFTNLSVSFGCTGGQHRSVFFAEKLAKALSQNPDIDIVLKHLEQNK
jgi:aminoglycoside/choline kinase family phosphotransferase